VFRSIWTIAAKKEQGKVLKVLTELSLKSNFEKAAQAIAEALTYGVKDLGSLVAIHNSITNITPHLKPLEIPKEVPKLTEFHVKDYDRAFLKGDVDTCLRSK